MVGTYSTIPDLNWAVVAQRGLDKAREDAGVTELNAQALKFVVVVTFAALILGYLFAVGISTPIRALAASTLAISRGEFHQRTPVQGAAEISELAETFNTWPATSRNSSSSSGRPRTRTMSSSSARFACSPPPSTKKIPTRAAIPGAWRSIPIIIAQQLGLASVELEKIRISALLARRGKNRSRRPRPEKARRAHRRKNSTLMKQHPLKGANIMRPSRS